MACGKLAKLGVKVLGIDKTARLDQNSRAATGYCFLDQPFNNEIIELTAREDSATLNYTKTGFTLEYNAHLPASYFFHMFTDTGKHFQVETTKKPFYHMFLPGVCKSDRFAWATKEGAEFMTETLVLGVTQTEDQVEVKCRTNGKDRRLTCKKLIASDGLASIVAKTTGANEGRTFFGKGPTIEYEMDGVEVPYGRGGMFFFGANNFGGRAGAVIMVPSPHGEKAYRMETMSVLPASSATDIIEYFVHKSPFAHWFKKGEIIETTAAICTMMSPMIVPQRGNILFVGDSAAYAECLYQSATMAGYMGAVCTAEELDGKPGFERYNQWWGDSFEWVRNPKRMADYTKTVLFPRFFTVRELDFLFDLNAKYPAIIEEPNATPYDLAIMIMKACMAYDEVPEDMKKRMQMVIDADMGAVASVIGKVQEA